MSRIASFAPIVGAGAHTLILGSMPSVKSLADRQYYAHPQNAFWRILLELYGQASPLPYEQRAELLRAHGIALWDVCMSCEREGSLDSAIRDVLPNDIPGLLRDYPIERIAFNGGTAQALARRHFGDVVSKYDTRCLPSTSPANTLPYRDKRAAWQWIVTPPKNQTFS